MLPLLTLANLLALPIASVPADVGSACLSGQVVDIASQPVARAAVTLIARGARGVRAADLLHSVRSDGGGGFALSDVPAGDYWMVVERPGYEHEILDLVLGTDEDRAARIQLTPGVAYLRTTAGRLEAPWQLRAMGSDPLRIATTGPRRVPEAEAFSTRPIQGRVGWRAVAGEGTDGGAVLGQRASVELEGLVSDDLAWFVDGRLAEVEYRSVDGTDSIGDNHIQYGVDFSHARSELAFRGELQQVTSEFAGSPDALAQLRRLSYRLDYHRSGQRSDLGLSFGYRESVSGDAVDELLPSQRHSIWEGRGEIARQIAKNHQLRSLVAIRAQSWSSPDRGMLVAALPTGGLLRDGRYLDPSSWQLFVRESYEWSVATPLEIVSGVDLMHFSGSSGGALVRPRIGLTLTLSPSSRLSGETSWVLRDWSAEVLDDDEARAGALGFEVAFEQELGNATLRVEALRNAHRELDWLTSGAEPTDDYLVFALGSVDSHEIRLAVQSHATRGLRGRAGAAFGTAEGDLSFVPIASVGAAALSSPTLVQNGKIHYASATVGGAVERTDTDVVVSYRWLRGSDEAIDGFEHIDVQLEQGIPWRGLGGTKLDLQLALRGFLRKPSLPEESLAAVALPSPTIAAGVGVRF